MTLLSILDLAAISAGSTAHQALRNSVDLAQHAERWGYHRYWLAEHHNMVGLACSATAVLIAHVAAATRHIRVGSGGVMLPNHAPLVVAEQFGTLATLHPGRIDLGLGRAPGTDRPTMRALRQRLDTAEDSFVDDVVELQTYFGPAQAGQVVQAIPGVGTQVPIWILGSSLYGAQVAAHLGLPYAFASHFAPAQLLPALEIYRERFRPSPLLKQPQVMVAVNVIVADSDAEAARLFTTPQQRFLGMLRGERGPLPPPINSMDGLWSDAEKAQAMSMLAVAAVGSSATVAQQLAELLAKTQADELIVSSAIYDHDTRLHSYKLLAQALQITAVAGAAAP